MISRQKLWVEVWMDILRFVIFWAIKAGDLEGTIEESPDPFTGERNQRVVAKGDSDLTFEVVFPEILERNVTDRVRALTNAVTLFGKELTDIVPDKRLVARWLLEAMNIPNVEQLIPEFVKMWEQNQGLYDEKLGQKKPVEAFIIPPATGGAKPMGAEDPSQGGAVGANG
jgi:hypothetical protein